MSAFATLTDDQLVERLRSIANQCVAIVSLPRKERTAPGTKGEASPEQAGALSAAFVLQIAAECERRGIPVWSTA